MTQWVLVAHVAAAACLTGVGWTVQLALYPLFERVGPDEWSSYHQAHSLALGRVVAAPWVVQGLTTVAILIRRPAGAPLWLILIDALLAAGPLAATALVAVPLHRRLAAEARADLVAALLRVNLVRTIAWTLGVVTGGALVAVTR